ncbi:MAG: SulP family inorganic anion transporter [Leptospira sp.]|nr:SulP family inorganic anion transporter [Leptospira sp.]
MSLPTAPKDWIEGLKENWKTDLVSGFIIFLIALPLCIGIALASGAPPMAGLLSGIVGGAIISIISGSYVTINGPAAGLIVIIFGSIEILGGGDPKAGFRFTLAAIVCAGILQIGMGFLKAGILASIFPASVIYGMLSAIGVIIFTKQIHVALGVVPQAKTLLGQMAEIPNSFMHLNPEIAFIGIVSIAILVGYPYIKSNYVKKIPAPLIAVVVAIFIAEFLDFKDQHNYFVFDKEYSIGPKSLVHIPHDFLAGLTFPDFGILFSKASVLQIITITLVASVESLLTVVAVDRLDPFRRVSDMNRELVAKGIGNTILGFIGGLPIIAEVVRSSANINNGAKTRWSNFFHGVFLLLFLLLLPGLLEKIPLASLAAILMVTGYRLAVPELKKAAKIGLDQFFIYSITLFFIIEDDLLVGVIIGIVVNLFLHYVNVILPEGITFNDFIRGRVEVKTNDGTSLFGKSRKRTTTLQLRGLAVFINFHTLKKQLDAAPRNEVLEIDLSTRLKVSTGLSLRFTVKD